MHPFLKEITPEIAEVLHAHATVQGLSVDAYLKALMGLGSAENTLADMSEEDFAALTEEFAKGTDHLPPLPADFSRDDIYSDHD